MRLRLHLFLTLLAMGGAAAFGAEGRIVYERDVAPVLRSYCAGCHNDVDRAGGLSVERLSSLRTGGKEEGDPIQPGKPDASFLIRSLEGRTSPRMPPKDEPRPPASDIALLRRWVQEGAVPPAHDGSILESLVVPEVPRSTHARPAVTALAFSPDGRRLAVGRHGGVELRTSDGSRVIRRIEGLPGKVTAVHYAADGRRLVVATGIPGLRGVARLYESGTGRLVREFGGHRDMLQDAELAPDGATLATGGYDRLIRLWDVATGTMRKEIAVHNGAVFDLAFDPSGRVLASASGDQTVKLWRVSDGLRLDTLNQPQGELYRVAFSPDGSLVVAGGVDKRLHVWRLVSREAPAINPVVMSRFAHESAVQAIAFSSDGRQLVTTAADRSMKVWSFPQLEEWMAFPPQSDVVATLAAVPRKAAIVAGRMDGTVQRWDLPAGSGPSGTPARAAVAAASTPDPAAPVAMTSVVEQEPNNGPLEAQGIGVPATIRGTVGAPGDRDLFRFHARAGEELTLAVNAARSGSRLDSRVEVLHPDGRPVEQAVLQAVRDSWFTFRGKDSDTVDDFRLQNWTEMDLDQLLYADGEVVKLWLYPRGPDSGFKVYPGTGKRQPLYNTTALTHALNAPCYIVTPWPAGATPVANGLPVFHVNFENDDDPSRRWGADSLLLFTSPADGDYLARVTDVRGFGGATNFHYSLEIRPRRPDFTVAVEGMNPRVSPGSGRELRFVASRMEGFEGPIRIDIENLPAGFSTSTPVEIEAGQESAVAVIQAASGVVDPDDAADKRVRVVAVARIGGREARRELGTLGNIQRGDAPKLTVEILPGKGGSAADGTGGQEPELRIRPGETITARVRAVRHDFAGRIELGGDDSGRNLPHGVYVDNIGLNGLLIVEGQSEREFFITAARKVQPGVRRFHLRATADGGQVSPPVTLRILAPVEAAAGKGGGRGTRSREGAKQAAGP